MEKLHAMRTEKYVGRQTALEDVLDRVRSQNRGDMSGFLLVETIRLWQDILEVAGRVYSTIPPLRSKRADLPPLLGQHLDDDPSIDATIELLGSVVLGDEDAERAVLISALGTVTPTLANAVAGSASGQTVMLLSSSGTLEDPSADISLLNSRAKLLLGTERAVPLVRAMQEDIDKAAMELRLKVEELKVATEDLAGIRETIAEEREKRAHFNLAAHYQTLASNEAEESTTWRWATLGLIVLAIIATVLSTRQEGWEAIVGHLAVAAALGGASTYTARLSSVHRSMADWAKGINVQLNTLDDFLATIEDTAARVRVKEEFSRRVLGAPPTVGGDDMPSLPMAQLLEIANAISKGREP